MSLSYVLSHFKSVERRGGGYAAKCPAHDDRRASLSIGTGRDGRVLIYDHAGCPIEDILKSAGLTFSDLHGGDGACGTPFLIATSYDYTDEEGQVLFQVCRLIPKDFRQRRPDGSGGYIWNMQDVRLVPYRLPHVLKAVRGGEPVFICEGEKDVHALERKGFTATCNPGGAGKWPDCFKEFFREADVYILPDNDKPGKAHAEQVAMSLYDVARIKIVDLPVPEKGDPYDYFLLGGSADDLSQICAGALVYRTDRDLLLEAYEHLKHCGSPFAHELAKRF